MNPNLTSFPLIEKILVYGSVFITCVFIIVMSSLLNNEKRAVKAGNLFFYFSLIFFFFLNILLFLYVKLPKENIAGIEIKQIYLFLFLIFLGFIILSYKKFETVTDYILFFIALIASQFIFLQKSILIIFLSFIVFEISLSFLIGQINNKKYFYFFISLIFLGIYLIGDKNRIQTIGINGATAFLMLSTFATTRTLNINSIQNNNEKRYNNVLFISIIISLIVFFKWLEFYNLSYPFFYVLFLISFILILLSVFNLLTEEDLSNFFVSDFINIFFLTILVFSVLILYDTDILFIFVSLISALVLLVSFFSDCQKKYSVTYTKYNFNKIKGAGLLLTSICLSFLIEIYLIYKVIVNFTYLNSYIQIIIFFVGFVYAINLLNKTFIILSMLKRIQIDNLKYILFNKIIIKPVLFVLFIISLILWWNKNG